MRLEFGVGAEINLRSFHRPALRNRCQRWEALSERGFAEGRDLGSPGLLIALLFPFFIRIFGGSRH